MTDAVDQLFEARIGRTPIAALMPPPADEAAAYRVQDRLHARLARAGFGAVVGFKIGCTTEVMQRYLGIASPCEGAVLARTVRHQDGHFMHRAFVRVGVECELAAQLGQAVEARRAPHTRDALARAVSSMMCAIEVVDDRWQDYRRVDGASLIADDFFGAGCVLGAPCAQWQDLDLRATSARMSVNGECVGAGHGRDILGDPLEALVWLANARAARGLGLEAGQFILLGSMVQTCWLAAGDTVQVSVEGFGCARARFSA